MGKLVLEPLSDLAAQYGEGWRVALDPEHPLLWRCRMFTFEFFWIPGGNSNPSWEGEWLQRDTPENTSQNHNVSSCCHPTPAREALWLDLFLRP